MERMEILKLGSSGNNVVELQKLLNDNGFRVNTDGNFGSVTESAVKVFQERNSLSADGIVGPRTWSVLKRENKKNERDPQYPFPVQDYFLKDSEYFTYDAPKSQIVLHHTVSSGNAINVISGWNRDGIRIGTAFVIDRNGVIFRAFDEDKWAWHLGTKLANNTALNKNSIGIELCTWGGLTKKGSKYYSHFGVEVTADEVYDVGYKFRGYRYYQKATDMQLGAAKVLIRELSKRYNIPVRRIYDASWFEYNQNAISETPGLWTHVNYRKDKSDLCPQPELINMLNSL